MTDENELVENTIETAIDFLKVEAYRCTDGKVLYFESDKSESREEFIRRVRIYETKILMEISLRRLYGKSMTVLDMIASRGRLLKVLDVKTYDVEWRDSVFPYWQPLGITTEEINRERQKFSNSIAELPDNQNTEQKEN